MYAYTSRQGPVYILIHTYGRMKRHIAGYLHA